MSSWFAGHQFRSVCGSLEVHLVATELHITATRPLDDAVQVLIRVPSAKKLTLQSVFEIVDEQYEHDCQRRRTGVG